MTECNQEVFSFASHFSRRVEASFTAGRVSANGGALLLRQADRKIGLPKRVASCFTDRRSPLLVVTQTPRVEPVETGVFWQLRALGIRKRGGQHAEESTHGSGDHRSPQAV